MQRDLSNLHTLRNLMKRDPEAYHGELKQQLGHFEANLKIFQMTGDSAKDTKAFGNLVVFISHVTPSYPDDCKSVPMQLLDLIENHYSNLERDLRKIVVQGIILLCNRGALSRLKILPVFFKLFRCHDKQLRAMLFHHIVADIKRVNKHTKSVRLNKALQNFMFTMLKDENRTAAKKSLDVMVALWRRNVWRDAKTVNALSTACFSKDSGIMTGALYFFLGMEDLEDVDEYYPDAGELMREIGKHKYAMTTMKRTKKRERKVSRTVSKIKRLNRDEDDENTIVTMSLPAIQLVHDPQGFADRLFSQLKRSTHPFEKRLLMMNVISRFIGCHQLMCFNFYPFLQKYLQPHQEYVTKILSYMAQASHRLVPPDVLDPIIRTLANNFVTDRSSPEVMTVGINAIREICARCPFVMTEELLRDLVMYKKSREKGVYMAARSLVTLFRELNPLMLKSKDRGKDASMNWDETMLDVYGKQKAVEEVDDLRELMQAGIAGDENDDDEWDLLSKPKPQRDEWYNSDDDIDFDLLPDDDADDDDDEDDDDDDKDGDATNADGSASSKKVSFAPFDKKRNAKSEAAKKRALAAAEEDSKRGKNRPYGSIKIMTPKDFARLKALRARQSMEQQHGTKRKAVDEIPDLDDYNEEVDVDDIIGWRKKQKMTREEKMAELAELRGDNSRSAHRREKAGRGGLTNAEKQKFVPYMLAKNSTKVRQKARNKFSTQQRTHSKHVKGMKKNLQKRRKRARGGKKGK
jgi:protein SDA1